MESIVEMKKRGTITIPEPMRKVLGLKEGSIFSIEIKEVLNKKKD